MNMLKKIVTLLRGGAREVGEGMVDNNAIRILEQEIADQENAVIKAKDTLTEVMAGETQTKRKITILNDKIGTHENYAAEAIAKGDEALALEVAEKIAGFENEAADLNDVLESYRASLQTLNEQIHHRYIILVYVFQIMLTDHELLALNSLYLMYLFLQI